MQPSEDAAAPSASVTPITASAAADSPFTGAAVRSLRRSPSGASNAPSPLRLHGATHVSSSFGARQLRYDTADDAPLTAVARVAAFAPSTFAQVGVCDWRTQFESLLTSASGGADLSAMEIPLSGAVSEESKQQMADESLRVLLRQTRPLIHAFPINEEPRVYGVDTQLQARRDAQSAARRARREREENERLERRSRRPMPLSSSGLDIESPHSAPALDGASISSRDLVLAREFARIELEAVTLASPSTTQTLMRHRTSHAMLPTYAPTQPIDVEYNEALLLSRNAVENAAPPAATASIPAPVAPQRAAITPVSVASILSIGDTSSSSWQMHDFSYDALSALDASIIRPHLSPRQLASLVNEARQAEEKRECSICLEDIDGTPSGQRGCRVGVRCEVDHMCISQHTAKRLMCLLHLLLPYALYHLTRQSARTK
jgi:hypothetical protein